MLLFTLHINLRFIKRISEITIMNICQVQEFLETSGQRTCREIQLDLRAYLVDLDSFCLSVFAKLLNVDIVISIIDQLIVASPVLGR